MTTKITNAMALNFVLTSYDIPVEYKEKLEKMLVQTEKKNASTGTRKPSANQLENASFGESIVEMLGQNSTALTISDIIANVPALEGKSNQRVSAIVSQLVSAGKVVRQEVKGRAYFTLAE